MKPLRQRKKNRIRCFGAHWEANSSDRQERKSLTGQALGNASFAVSRRQVGRTDEPASTGSVAGSPRVGKTGSKAQAPLPAGGGTGHRDRTEIKATASQWQHQHLPEKVNIFLLSALGRFLLTWFNWVLAPVKALERDNLSSVTEELWALAMVTSLFAQSTYEPILSSLSAVWPG